MRTFQLAGVEVPRIGLGTNRLTTASEHVAFVREAVAEGVRHIDTAHLYSGGDSERAIGEALSGVREDVLVATKGGYRPGEGQPEALNAQIEQSLRSLGTDVIGLYYLHRVDPETPLEESLGAIKEYADRGSIRNIGLSEVGIEQIERARQIVPIAPCRTATASPTASTTRSSTTASARGSRSWRTSHCAGRGGREWRKPRGASG